MELDLLKSCLPCLRILLFLEDFSYLVTYLTNLVRFANQNWKLFHRWLSRHCPHQYWPMCLLMITARLIRLNSLDFFISKTHLLSPDLITPPSWLVDFSYFQSSSQTLSLFTSVILFEKILKHFYLRLLKVVQPCLIAQPCHLRLAHLYSQNLPIAWVAWLTWHPERSNWSQTVSLGSSHCLHPQNPRLLRREGRPLSHCCVKLNFSIAGFRREDID